MIKWLSNLLINWKIEREFKKKLKKLQKLDPFVYDKKDDSKNN